MTEQRTSERAGAMSRAPSGDDRRATRSVNGDAPPSAPRPQPPGGRDRYRWVVLSNTTIAIFLAMVNGSIVLISLPAIFRGIHVQPLAPANFGYLLWMFMGYMVVSAVLVVSFGRIGDIFGRVRMYNAGFAIFTAASIALALTPGSGAAAALWMILMRIVQGIGGALLWANSAAIITDAFAPEQRGMALGINQIAGIAGAFVGLILGGLLATVDWRLVFWVSVPVGIFGTVWAYLKLHDQGERRPARIDWWGNTLFAAGLVLVLVGITYGIMPAGGHTMGWQSPKVIAELAGGAALLVAFLFVERRVAEPLVNLELFRIRAFAAGNLAAVLAAMGRGGMQFMLIIWLQGIWLPLHGYRFEDTPLWAGIYMLPLTAGFLVAGPLSGWLSDRFGPRPFATAGMLVAAASFGLLTLLPANFAYGWFALLVLGNGLGMGLFAAPNTSGIMNSVPARQRGQASGMLATFMNSGTVLSMGLFFSLVVVGLASSLPHAMFSGLLAHGVPRRDALRISHAPPVGSLFAAFLGYNPMATLLGPTLHHLRPSSAAVLTSKRYFPTLMSRPFMDGLEIVFLAAFGMCLLAAAASSLRGGRYIHKEAGLVGAAAGAPGTERGAEELALVDS